MIKTKKEIHSLSELLTSTPQVLRVQLAVNGIIASHEELREQNEAMFAQAGKDAIEITELKAELTESYRAYHWLFRALRRVSRTLYEFGEHSYQMDRMAWHDGILEPDKPSYVSGMITRLQSFLPLPVRSTNGFREYVKNHPQAQADREEMLRMAENDVQADYNYRYERDKALIEAAISEAAICIARDGELNFDAIIAKVDNNEN